MNKNFPLADPETVAEIKASGYGAKRMPQTLATLQWRIYKWHQKTFPTIADSERPSRILRKFREEALEFLCATGELSTDTVCSGKDTNPAEEAADIIVTLLGWAAFSNIDLAQALEEKIVLNEEKKFELRNGRYFRVGKDYPDALDGD